MKRLVKVLLILLITVIIVLLNQSSRIMQYRLGYRPDSGLVFAAGEQVSGLKARHYSGQTILTWTEAPVLSNQIPESMTLEQLKELREQSQNIRYRVYRSENPITSIEKLKPIADVPALSGWNGDFYGIEYELYKDKPALRYVVDIHGDGQPGPVIARDTAVYACNGDTEGRAYYAVTLVVNDVENTEIGNGNTLAEGVEETVGQGVPILQRVEYPKQFIYVANPTAFYYYTRWESPPNASVQGKPFDYLVALPPGHDPVKPSPVLVMLHCWSGSLNSGMCWWYNWEKGAILLSTNQIPYDWWTGYHELMFTETLLMEDQPANWRNGVVRPFTQNRVLSFLDFVCEKWNVDKSRCFTAGSSMGGSGSIMMGIRHPERFAWVVSWVGVHIPSESPRFKESYEKVYGKKAWGIRFEDGQTPAFDYFDDEKYLRSHVGQDTPFITFSNGKNDEPIGWGQAVKFWKALQDTKRPHIFVWGQDGHHQRAVMPMSQYEDTGSSTNPIDMRVDQSMPAFTQCSLDDDPGSGDPEDGDPRGQINLYLFWETRDIIDEVNHWEMTVGLTQYALKDSCTVNLTPRRLQNLRVVPGQSFSWTNTSLEDDIEIQSGSVAADEHGLVTLEGVRVEKRIKGRGGNRIVVNAGPVPVGQQVSDIQRIGDINGEPAGGRGLGYILGAGILVILLAAGFLLIRAVRRQK